MINLYCNTHEKWHICRFFVRINLSQKRKKVRNFIRTWCAKCQRKILVFFGKICKKMASTQVRLQLRSCWSKVRGVRGGERGTKYAKGMLSCLNTTVWTNVHVVHCYFQYFKRVWCLLNYLFDIWTTIIWTILCIIVQITLKNSSNEQKNRSNEQKNIVIKWNNRKT